MPRMSNLPDRQRRLFPNTEVPVSVSAEQQQELRIVMADLLLSVLVNDGSNSTHLCNDTRSIEDERKTD